MATYQGGNGTSNARISPLGWLGIALIVAIGLLVFFGALSMSAYGGYYGMMGPGMMGGSFWGWGILMMAVPAIILIVILVAVLGGLGPRTVYAPYPVPAPPPGVPPGTAADILDNRYARGELSREEYLRMREDLTPGPPSH